MERKPKAEILLFCANHYYIATAVLHGKTSFSVGGARGNGYSMSLFFYPRKNSTSSIYLIFSTHFFFQCRSNVIFTLVLYTSLYIFQYCVFCNDLSNGFLKNFPYYIYTVMLGYLFLLITIALASAWFDFISTKAFCKYNMQMCLMQQLQMNIVCNDPILGFHNRG